MHALHYRFFFVLSLEKPRANTSLVVVLQQRSRDDSGRARETLSPDAQGAAGPNCGRGAYLLRLLLRASSPPMPESSKSPAAPLEFPGSEGAEPKHSWNWAQ